MRANDIIAFRLPETNKTGCLRIIGKGGDKVEIFRGQIFVNDKPYQLPESSLRIYTVYSKTGNFSGLKQYDYKSYSKTYGLVKITQKDANDIKGIEGIDSIYETQSDSTYVYPNQIRVSTSKYLNHYYFGPVYIPEIGDTLYKKDEMLVNRFEKFDSPFKIISEELFFCMGDSFSDAMDSRILGLIPKRVIYGRVRRIPNLINGKTF